MQGEDLIGMADQKLNSRILFVSHDASRSGAPILMLNFLRWIDSNTDLDFEVLIRTDGELRKDFEALAPVRFFHAEPPAMPAAPAPRMFTRVLQACNLKPIPKTWTHVEWAEKCRSDYLEELQLTLKQRNFSVIYSNTMVNGDVLEALSSLDIPIITHVHELEDIIQTFSQFWPLVKDHTDFYIAASQAVKLNLIENHSLPEEAIAVVHESVPFSEGDSEVADRKSLGLPADVFLVCASAKGEWRKGPDLFVLLAERVHRLFGMDNYHFMWVGGWVTEQDRRRTFELVKKLDMAQHITFTGVVENPRDYYAVSDVFAMVSREDPFPLVCLEAASVGVPLLCFEKAGGVPEFVENDAGFIVPFSDVQIMAEKIRLLSENPALKETLGANARRKVQEVYSHERICSRLMEIIEKVSSSH